MEGHRVARNGLKQIGIDSLLLEQAEQPLPQEFAEVSAQGSDIHCAMGEQISPVGRGTLQQPLQIETPVPLPEDLQQAVASTAQGIGI